MGRPATVVSRSVVVADQRDEPIFYLDFCHKRFDWGTRVIKRVWYLHAATIPSFTPHISLHPQLTYSFARIMFPFGIFAGIVRPFRATNPPIEDSDDEMVGVLKVPCFCSYDIANTSFQQRMNPCL